MEKTLGVLAQPSATRAPSAQSPRRHRRLRCPMARLRRTEPDVATRCSPHWKDKWLTSLLLLSSHELHSLPPGARKSLYCPNQAWAHPQRRRAQSVRIGLRGSMANQSHHCQTPSRPSCPRGNRCHCQLDMARTQVQRALSPMHFCEIPCPLAHSANGAWHQALALGAARQHV